VADTWSAAMPSLSISSLRQSRALLAAVLALCALAAAPTASAADSEGTELTGFRPVADTYVDAGRPWTAFGRQTRLRASALTKRTYLRFRVDGIGEVVDATLYVRVVNRRWAPFKVRSAQRHWWNEQALTYRRAPRVLPGSRVERGWAHQGWTAVDVSSLVTGNGPVTLVLSRGTRGARIAFGSRESGLPALLKVRWKQDTAPTEPPPTTDPPAEEPPAPPADPYEGRVGFSGSNVWYSSDKQLAYMNKLRSGGVSWLREDFHWGAFEPTQGNWTWTVGDRLMRNASTAGLNILGIFAYSSDWGADGPTIYHPPRDPAQYANFCRKVVERYGPGGTFWAANPQLDPRPLTAVEIWNEPWLTNFWKPNPDPARYATLVRAASAAIHAAQPTIKVLASADIFQMRSDTTQSRDWFRLLMENDADTFRDYVDAYSVHAYVQDRSPLDTATAQRWRFDRVLMTRDLAAAHSASKPIWITEFGWSTEAGSSDSVSESEQATYSRQALEVALEDWSPLVEKAFLFYWGESGDSYTGGYSPLRTDGSSKPLWTTLNGLLR
jgi:hypothetical protein